MKKNILSAQAREGTSSWTKRNLRRRLKALLPLWGGTGQTGTRAARTACITIEGCPFNWFYGILSNHIK